MRRLFFALLPDQAVREQLRRLQKSLEPMGGRPVPADNLHLTLLFLGHVAARQVGAVRGIAAGIEGTRFELLLDTLGGFPQNHARVLWVGPSESPPELEHLHRSLRQQVREIGHYVKKESYRPHVSLTRKAVAWERLPDPPARGIPWIVRRCALLASELRPDGAHYEVLIEKEFS